jgi:hypothetical protein
MESKHEMDESGKEGGQAMSSQTGFDEEQEEDYELDEA